MKHFRPTRLLLYATLIAGAVVFSFPFVWMASSSVKVDRELYTDDLTIRPLKPSASPVSPWIDKDYYNALPGTAAYQATVLPAIAKLTDPLVQPFARLNQAALSDGVARGVYQRLSRMLPASAWAGTPEQLAAAAKPLISNDLVGEVERNITRRLAIGTLRLGFDDDNEADAMPHASIAGQWTNISPDVATMIDDPTAVRRPDADVAYDFSHGDGFAFTQTLALTTTSDHIARLRLPIHPDDSWHSLSLIVETAGKRWEAVRDIPLANFEWQTFTWQWPSDDDNSLKEHNWINLKEIGQSTVTDPKTMKLTLAVHQASPAKAWWNKTRLNYDRVRDSIPFFRYLRVSLFLVAANMVLTLFTSSFVAYAFSRLHWPGRDACFVLMLATMMIPGQVLMIPHFLIWKEAGAFDTLTPLWLPALFGNAFYIFMLRQFIRGLPVDLEEAARIDGCNFLGIYWHVILPLIKPSLAAIAIFTFMASWNDFFGPLLYVADQRLYPLSFGLYALAVEVENSPTITMAAGVLMTVPVIAIFFAAQRYFVQGITLTGMKG